MDVWTARSRSTRESNSREILDNVDKFGAQPAMAWGQCHLASLRPAMVASPPCRGLCTASVRGGGFERERGGERENGCADGSIEIST
jgi:hypothetical protein